jgi:hypothetical protein
MLSPSLRSRVNSGEASASFNFKNRFFVGEEQRPPQNERLVEFRRYLCQTRSVMTEYLLPLKYRQKVARDTMAFWFNTLGTGYTFKAGQNADFLLIDAPKTDGDGNARTFSFATSPNDPAYLMIAMRMRKSAFKENLRTIPLGTQFKVTPPMGSFTLHKDSSKPAVFLAGGHCYYTDSQHLRVGNGRKITPPAVLVLFQPYA